MADINWGGRQYQLVSLDQITLDEAILVYQYTGLTLDQIPDLDGFHPGLIAALIHISVARAEPNESQSTIRKAVGQTPVSDLETIFAGISEEVADDVPLPNATSNAASSSGSGGSGTPTGESPPEPSEGNGSGSRGSAIGATSGPGTWGT